MKKKDWLIVGVVGVIIVVVCVFFYLYFIKWNAQLLSNEEEKPVETENEAIFSLEDYPIVDGSTATMPLMDAFKANFTNKPIDEVKKDVLKTHQAYLSLIDGDTDLIVVTSPSEDELEYAKEKNVELEVIPVVKEAFVFLMNKNNPVKSLTLKQIQDIYAGNITNWKEVGGNDAKIKAYQRPVNSGSQTGMLDLVMKGIKMKEAETTDIAVGMGDLIDVVADFDNTEYAIGYSYYYYATEMYIKENANLLAVDGVEPNFDTIKNDEYPIQTRYYIVIDKAEPEDGNVRKLVNAMLSARGQAVAKDAGYVPMY